MAKTGLMDNKNEFQRIMEHISQGNNFLLSGGAGSGKTYTLVEVIRQVIEDNPISKIACMTYTNAAVKEIEERVNHKNLIVSTIHDFLWDNIKHFQKEIKEIIIELANDIDIPQISIDESTPIDINFFNDIEKIQYKEYLRLKEGIISHDEVLLISNFMFKKHKKLCNILKDKFKFIFIDEYQDTHSEVVEIFLDYLTVSPKKTVVGFFGDAMQSIYPDGIGDLNEYIDSGAVVEVKKEQNRRNPKKVYELANILRAKIDGLVQTHSDDLNAPNMENGIVKEGNIKFIYSNDGDLNKVRSYLNWDFNDSKETKELNLTHNLIADKANFRLLMDIYDKERIIELKNRIVKEIKEKNIEISEDATFGDVIELVNYTASNRNQIGRFIDENPDLFEEAKKYPFSKFKGIYVKSDMLVDDKKQDVEDENKKGSKRDKLIKHLFKIQDNLTYYKRGDYNEFVRKTEFKITKSTHKIALKSIIEGFSTDGKTIEDIINLADDKGICKIDDNLKNYISDNEYIYNRVKKLKFSQFQNLYKYLEGYTPFSTQHKTKGNEFNNVLVILDNGRWNDYNFEYLFLESGTESVLNRTQKIFYVCCTRAKENLAVYFHSPKPQVIGMAKKWFGESNVIEIDNL